MPWRDAQALHIFVPPQEPYGDNWVEQILGTTVLPLYQQFTDDIRWMWVTRYTGLYDEAAPPVECSIPEYFRTDKRYRYIVFRVSARDEVQQEVKTQAIRKATEGGCFADLRGWLDYDVVADLGKDRFIKAMATAEERTRRARLIANFVDATVRLMLDALVQDEGGKWRLEQNQDEQNPHNSFFESVHHLFCNATWVPTTVLINSPVRQIIVGTHWRQPLLFDVEPAKFTEIPIGY